MSMTKLRRFSSDQSGATAIEYGLIAGLISISIIIILGTLEGSLSAMFEAVGNFLASIVVS